MRKIIFFVSIIIFLFIINNFFHSIYGLWQKQDLITEAKNELIQAKHEQQSLQKQLKIVSKSSYVEEEARNKLLLVKPGEEVVVLPQPTPVPVTTSGGNKKILSAWEQWYKLFF